MKIDEILQRKQLLQEEFDRLANEIRDAKVLVLKEIKNYVKEFNVSFAEIKDLYDELNLSTALVQVVTPKEKPPTNRKGYKYYNAKNGKWFNGYQKFPKWFDLTKADQYLISGQTHAPMVKKALSEQGLDKSVVKNAFTEAQIKEWKEGADQLNKLYKSKRLSVLASKRALWGHDLKHVLTYCDPEVVEHLSF